MAPGASTPKLEAVPLEKVISVLCVEVDWCDWVRRHGLEAMPASTPSSDVEYRRRRMFVNAFVGE